MADKIRKSCANCWHYKTGANQGVHCTVYSVSCATAIFNQQEPTRWLYVLDGLSTELTEQARKEEARKQ